MNSVFFCHTVIIKRYTCMMKNLNMYKAQACKLFHSL